MERQLFDWESWDVLDTADFYFHTVTLKQPIGSYPIGTKFAGASVSYERGTLEFYDGEDKSEVVGTFRLGLTVLEPV